MEYPKYTLRLTIAIGVGMGIYMWTWWYISYVTYSFLTQEMTLKRNGLELVAKV